MGSLTVKKNGAYVAPVGVFVKKNGVYQAVSGIYAKFGGVYSSISANRAVATRGEANLLRAQSNTTDKVRLTGRARHKAGKSAITRVGVALTNWYLHTDRTELATGNAVTVRAHVEYNGVAVPVTWGGATSGLMPNDSLGFESDLLATTVFGGANIPAGATFYTVVECTVAFNEYIPASVAPQDTGEGATYGNGTASQIGVAGAIVNQSGGAVTNAMPIAAAVIGATATPIASVALCGDSLVFGFKDGGPAAVGGGGGESSGGMFPRACWDIGGGNAIPWIRMARTGTTAQQASTNFTKQAALLKYVTHFMSDLGTNDLNAGRTAAQAYADSQTIWALARAQSKAVWQMLIINRCSSSTDAWATVANQTILTGFENGGSRKDPLNAFYSGAVGTLVTGVINMNPGWADTVVTDKILAPGATDDGVHTLPASAANAKNNAVPIFAGFVAP